MLPNMIATVKDLIEELGGTKAVAAMRGVTFNAVSNWRAWDRLPDRHKYALFKECEARGLDVSPILFDREAV